jgi:hypothetical protein
MKLRPYQTLSGASGLLVVVSAIVTGHKEAQFLHNPQIFNAHDGHTIPLALRGIGTVYLTLAELQSYEPYVYAQYASLALMVLVFLGGLAYERYWRSRR